MAKIGQRIIDKAFEILRANPEGVRYSDLARQISAKLVLIAFLATRRTLW